MNNRILLHRALISATLLFVAFGVEAALIVNSPAAITQLVTVQPIVVSDDLGGNTATFFGTTSEQGEIESFIDSIWAQAGIDVAFLAPRSWNSTFANSGTASPRPQSDLNVIVSNAPDDVVKHSDPNVINMFFVQIAAGFPSLDANSAAGLATVGGNGITQYVGANLLGFTGGLEVIASVVAHELGHNLGLDHLVESENLMQAGGSPNPGERLNAAQIQTALDSNLSTVVVPLPAGVWLLGGALVAVVLPRRRRALFATA